MPPGRNRSFADFGMRVIALSRLRAFWEGMPDAKGPLEAWYYEVKQAQWSTPVDIKAQEGYLLDSGDPNM